MKIRARDGKVQVGSLFKLASLGYLMGAGLIAVPVFLLATLFTLLAISAGMPANANGAPVTGGLALVTAAMPLIVLPFILALQAIMFGGLITLGLWLYTRRRPIEIIEG